MSLDDDDLAPFRDDPVFRALVGPASPGELAGGAEVFAAFRAATASRPRSRFIVRVGTSGAIAAAAVVLSGSVAAAYTAELPAQVQQTLHAALGPIGVPAPQHHHRAGSGGAQSATSPAPAPAPAPASTRPSTDTRAASPRSATTPTTAPGSPNSSPVVTPTGPIVVTTPTTPPSTPPPNGGASLQGATLTLTASASTVPVGSAITIVGQLTAANATPLSGVRVSLVERSVGEPEWTHVAVAATADDGAVSFASPAIERNSVFVLRAGDHVHSTAVRVVAAPQINFNVTSSATAPGQETVTVTVTGSEQGDVIALNPVGRGRHRQQQVLDATGTAMFVVDVPKHRAVTYRLLVRGTQAHGSGVATFSVPPAG